MKRKFVGEYPPAKRLKVRDHVFYNYSDENGILWFDRMDTIGLFQEKILPNLTEPLDIIRASRACKKFKFYLKDRLPGALLAECLRLLKADEYVNPRFSDDPMATSLLKLRTVSAEFKESVETVYFEDLFTTPEWHLRDEFSHFAKPFIFSMESLESVKKTFEEGKTGKSFLRIIDYRPDMVSVVNQEEFHRRFIDFLKRNGRHVWHFVYHNGQQLSEGNNYELFHEMVSLMPNLKVITVKILDYQQSYDDHDGIRHQISSHPFPVLPHLKVFEFSASTNVHVISEIIKNNSNIKTVKMDRIWPWSATEMHPIINDAVKSLNLDCYHGPYFNESSLPANTYWSLKALKLFIPAVDRHCVFTSDTLFPLLNQLKNSLMSLKLLDSGIVNAQTNATVSLDLPYLKHLELEQIRQYELFINTEHLIGLQDLSGLKSLEDFQFSGTNNYAFIEDTFNLFPMLKKVWPIGGSNSPIERDSFFFEGDEYD